MSSVVPVYTFTFDKKNRFKSTSSKADVFNGQLFKDNKLEGDIVVKRYKNVSADIIKASTRDLAFLTNPKNSHPNFISYFGEQKDAYFT